MLRSQAQASHGIAFWRLVYLLKATRYFFEAVTVIPTLSLWIKHLLYGQEIDLEHWVHLNVKNM